MKTILMALVLIGGVSAAQAQVVIQPPGVFIGRPPGPPPGPPPGDYWRHDGEWRRREEIRDEEARRIEWRRAHCVRDWQGHEFCRP